VRFQALQITQPSGRQVYVFAATADELLKVADVPRMGRSEQGGLVGYQRPEVAAHIAEIRRYLNGRDAVLPNAIVVAVDDCVDFIPLNGGASKSRSIHGTLAVPVPRGHQPKPGFVVDGQQRLAAVASCRHVDFPVFVTALIAPDIEEQRKQFLLVNRTKPLPQGLVFELLPEIQGILPEYLTRQRLAATITSRLNLEAESSLYRRIKTPTCPAGVIKDNSVRRMVLSSLSDGALFLLGRDYRDLDGFLSASCGVVSTFWGGVAMAFPGAWSLPPTRSRLTHGVGVAAMGYVMDHLYLVQRRRLSWSPESVSHALEPLRPMCAWTEGYWHFGEGYERRWNELQNTDRDIRLLTNHFRRHLTRTAPAG
jgi:DGQHR domain-containing protein